MKQIMWRICGDQIKVKSTSFRMLYILMILKMWKYYLDLHWWLYEHLPNQLTHDAGMIAKGEVVENSESEIFALGIALH